jgi:predicted  nucleic acid-binding Zn-ribbon protein
MRTINELNERLVELNEALMKQESELVYLEEILTTTTGPCSDIVEDIERTKEVITVLRRSYDSVYRQLKELRDVS